MKNLLFILIMLLSFTVFSKDYYVSINGSDKNDGLTESTAWRSISHAAVKAKSGDTVWIKAGNYGNENVLVNNDGTKGSPISFIGYKSSPGDITSMYYTYAKDKPLDSKEMPMLDGGHGGINEGFTVRGNYVTVKNIQISNYSTLMYVTNTPKGVVIDNILAHTAGRTVNQPGKQGVGVLFNSDAGNGNIIRNSTAVNCSVANFRVYGNNNLIENCKSYADRNDNGAGQATDYYIVIRGSDNIVRDCYVERVGDLSHNGHGISLKAVGNKTENNLIENSTIVNCKGAIEARHSQVKNNLFRNNVIKGWPTKSQNGGIVIHDGASYNIFENIMISGTNEAFRWYETSEQGSGVQGHHNIFRNIIVDNVNLLFYSGKMKDAKPKGDISDNKFINCTFNNIGELVAGFYKFDSTNNIENSIFSNISKYENKHIMISPEWTQFYNNYYRNGFDVPKGEGNISFDPQFKDTKKSNFRLKSTSQLIDAGKKIIEVKKDFDGNARPQGSSHDIGAFEFQDNSTSSFKANAGEDQTICSGEETTLTASGGSTFKWSNGATTKSITVSPSATETFTVTVSEGSVSDTDEVIVTVNKITVDAGKDVTIKEGENVTLTASGGSIYLWSNGETTESIIVSPTTTETYKVTVTDNGCEDTDSIKVNVEGSSPPPITVTANAGEDQIICTGESVTLTASGGAGYEWSNGETTKSITVSPTASETFTVTVSEGNVSDTDEVIVTVNTVTADAGKDVSIKEGESVTLTASGGSGYEWSTGETTESITVSPTATETYKIAVTENGCKDTASIKVTVEGSSPPPVTVTANAGEDQTICAGESVTLTASGGSTYLWSNGETVEKIKVTPLRTTNYSLMAWTEGIVSSDDIVVTVENCNNNVVSDNLNENLLVYPSPTSGVLNINMNIENIELNLMVISSNGSIVYSDKLNSIRGNVSKQIDISSIAKGVYLVKIFNANENVIKKVIVI